MNKKDNKEQKELRDKKRTQDKQDLAERVAQQKEKWTTRYDLIGGYFKQAFRWFSAWFDRIVFNPKYARVVAFSFAILVYLTFSAESVDTVVQAKSLSNVQVNAIYNREMYEVSGIESTVGVDVLGDYSDIIVVEPEEITVELDLRTLGEGTHQVDYVPVGVSSRVKAKVVPASARVTIRIKETKTMALSYEFINQDKLADQYVLGEVTLDSRDVTISASKETLDEIAFVKALIDVGGKTSTFDQEATIVAYNQNGEKLENADVIPRVVNAKVEVSSPNKTVPIYARFEGEIPDNKAVASIVMDHEAITIYGQQSVLDAIDEITVYIPASTLSSGKLTHNISLPTGVKHGSVSKVSVDVKLDDMVTKEFPNVEIVYRGNIHGYKIKAANEADFTTSLIVKGTQANLDKFDPSDVIVYVNMRDIQIGNGQDLTLYIDEQLPLLDIKSTKSSIKVDVIE
ncbi:MAG: hypothetical protein GX038_01380 [Erysipelothrix sp.]|nr:hypothetical protein [Erysipelothrix sp.]